MKSWSSKNVPCTESGAATRTDPPTPPPSLSLSLTLSMLFWSGLGFHGAVYQLHSQYGDAGSGRYPHPGMSIWRCRIGQISTSRHVNMAMQDRADIHIQACQYGVAGSGRYPHPGMNNRAKGMLNIGSPPTLHSRHHNTWSIRHKCFWLK